MLRPQVHPASCYYGFAGLAFLPACLASSSGAFQHRDSCPWPKPGLPSFVLSWCRLAAAALHRPFAAVMGTSSFTAALPVGIKSRRDGRCLVSRLAIYPDGQKCVLVRDKLCCGVASDRSTTLLVLAAARVSTRALTHANAC